MKRLLILFMLAMLALCLCGCGCAHKNTTTVNAVAATCTTAGYSGDVKCSDCGEIIQKGSEIAALGHAEGTPQGAYDATCDSTGSTGTIRCRYCGTVLSEAQEIPALGHDFATWKGTVEATCTTYGRTGKSACTRVGCGYIYKDRDTEFADHVMENGVCTVCGWKTSGLYVNGELKTSWEELVSSGAVTVNTDARSLMSVDKSLTGTLIIDESLTRVCSKALYGTGLTEIWFPRSMWEYDDDFLALSETLETARFYSPKVSLPNYSFAGCSVLRTVDFLHGPADIGWVCFAECHALEEIDLSRGTLTCISLSVFGNCTVLSRVYLPATLNQIYPDAFAGCPDSLTLYYPGTEEDWQKVDESLPDNVTIVYGVNGKQ